MAASVPVSRLLIFGGNGFVGQAIARKALLSGLEVISLSKNGFPKDLMHDLDKIPAYDTKV